MKPLHSARVHVSLGRRCGDSGRAVFIRLQAGLLRWDLMRFDEIAFRSSDGMSHSSRWDI